MARTLFQDIGAHILFVFLLITGLLLLTGASVAGLVAATRRAAWEVTRWMFSISAGTSVKMRWLMRCRM